MTRTRARHASPLQAGETLLVHFWYAHPVGHAVEALRYCLGYKSADPSLRVSVALNSATPTELGGACRFIDRTYAIHHRFPDAGGDPLRALAKVPRDWDWVVDDGRRSQPQQLETFPGLSHYYGCSDKHFRTRRGRGTAGAEPPAYVPHQQLVLELPEELREQARGRVGRGNPTIAVMTAGSGPRHWYPSVASWELILHALVSRYPGLLLCLIGKHARDERTATSFGHDDLGRLRRAFPNHLDCFDESILRQLAVVEACDLFLSPHTGFGMAALSVGTPWLALSGNAWHEYFFNSVPFYSLLPDPDRFPCFNAFGPEPPALDHDSEGEGSRSPSMSADRIRASLDELLEAASVLIRQRLTYEAAMQDHFRRLLAFYGGDRSRIWSLDNVHRLYL